MIDVILVMVISANGKITRGKDDPYLWASPEDRKHFTELKKRHIVIIYGRGTYEGIKDRLVLSPQLRRIIMTSRAFVYKTSEIAGQLEFTDEKPDVLVARLEAEGYGSVLLAGGSRLNASFLRERLITRCYLTIEPEFFGTGKNLFETVEMHARLKLVRMQQLNAGGTALLEYEVTHDWPSGGTAFLTRN